MSSIFLFDLASQRNQWLSLRQATVSGNIANANTPGYAALDVQPFEAVLQQSTLEMAATDPAHVTQTTQRLDNYAEPQEDAWHIVDSGNSVSLEKEMVKAGEINSAYSLSNNVIRSFHRMLLSSSKG